MSRSWSTPCGQRSAQVESFRLASLVDRIDPYLADLASSGRIGDGEWFQLLIQLTGKTAAEFARDAARDHDGVVHVAPWYAAPGPGLCDTAFVCAWVRRAFFAALGDPESYFAKHVERFELGMTSASERFRTSRSPAPPFASGARPGPGAGCVVVGIVDDGIAFGLERFHDARGRTRIARFWDQRDTPSAPGPASGPTVTHGVEWTADRLAELEALHRHAGLIDEDGLYAAAGQRQVAERARHGTHVLDLAAGASPKSASPSSGMGTPPVIMAVQLPAPTGADPSGVLLGPQLFDAVRYIVDRADRHAEEAGLRGPVPVVINVSYGLQGGPHDGSSMFEAAIDELVAHREALAGVPLAVVIAAGNSALARCHATFSLAPGASRTLQWRIPPDSEIPAFLELWLGHATPDSSGAGVTVRLVAPTATTNAAPAVGRGGYAQLVDDAWAGAKPRLERMLIASVAYVAEGSAQSGQLSSYFNDRDMVLVTVAPTSGTESDKAWAPAGIWSVEITNRGAEAIEIHGWIRRNDTPFGFRARGRQSRFEDPNYQVLDDLGRVQVDDDGPAAIRRRTTLNGIATGRATVVVGGHRRDDDRPAIYTAHGPAVPQAVTETTHRSGPDLLAPSDSSAARPGVLAAGTRSGSVVCLNGTSVAAPAVTRRLAQVLASGEYATTRDALDAIVIAHPDRADPNADRWGAGRLDEPVDAVRVPR